MLRQLRASDVVVAWKLDRLPAAIAERVPSDGKSAAETAGLYEISQPTVSRIVAAHRQRDQA
jgi:hypothetical protein